MILLFFCFRDSFLSFPCLYLEKICSIAFFILFSAKDSLLFMVNKSMESYFMLLILIKIFKLIKIEKNISGIIYHNHICFCYNNELIKLLQTFFSGFIVLMQKIVFVWFKFFNNFELFPAFNCANNIRSLINSFLELILLILLLFFFCFFLRI